MLRTFCKKIFWIILLLPFVNLSAQTTKLGGEVIALTKYMASKDFADLGKKIGDIYRTDSLYEEALKITHGDYSEALFALTFAAVPYKRVPIKIPLLGIRFDYPLVSAGDSLYHLKNKNLPKYLYLDSPKDNYGDKDKVAHFFGSAYVTYGAHFFDLGKVIGYFVEVFEQDFKVQSSIDERDLATDDLGNIFGEILKSNKKVLPSQVMLVRSLFYCRYHL
jgi:hypothetical protein